ncbi:hypothetical protein FUA48_03455 [Flavobacterium alkalisoli]|uniref:Uncharacterized protein n=1 Tax=Flavobacterium alkalisoli TaxID=2602769 RepID=A0A5B9FSB5_9FLAO|nr:DUF6000 family protein [Flavobacterium alkalisoli]QEE48658.1 hypothetical protein FUA48_03455 [Flavobacterium alkalisoli]
MNLKDILNHSAGAIIRHKNPFKKLPVPKNKRELPQEFINKWVAPCYMDLLSREHNQGLIIRLTERKNEITSDVIDNCLGDFNWRSRQTGAYFAAVTNRNEYVKSIGNLLLKSEVCYAGKVYCLVLAYFNTKESVTFLNTYLKFYLKQPDLWFDQKEAMQALAYLDKVNGTNNLLKHYDNWIKFIENKPNWEKDITTEFIENNIAIIEAINKRNI